MKLNNRIPRIFVALMILVTGFISEAGQGRVTALVGTTIRASVASDGTQANDYSWETAISANGRFIAFASDASNLVSGDLNGKKDIFVHDLETGETSLISKSSSGEQANDWSKEADVSADGRYVVFTTSATNLADNAAVGWNIYLHDRQTAETTLISHGRAGEPADDASEYGSISNDGRYVAFSSRASNLVENDLNDQVDVFVHDRYTGETRLASVSSDGVQGNGYSSGPSISADGQTVVFAALASNLVQGDTNNTADIFVYYLSTGETERISISSNGDQSNGGSQRADISDDGRYVVFISYASNLVPGDTNQTVDVFLHDLETGETRRVSVSSDGDQGDSYSENPSISANGRFIAFESVASNLVDEDVNTWSDIFVHDRETGETVMRTRLSDEVQANYDSEYPSISGDGRYVAYLSYATNLTCLDTNQAKDVYVHDRDEIPSEFSICGQVTTTMGYPLSEVEITTSTGASTVTDAGGFYLFHGILPGNYEITPTLFEYAFVPTSRLASIPPIATSQDFAGYDLTPPFNLTELISVSSIAVQGDKESTWPSISADGRFVAFDSDATNLVEGDTNGVRDIFLRQRDTYQTTRVSQASDGTQGDDDSFLPSISADGRYVTFYSYSSNLVKQDTNGYLDVFLYARETGETTLVSVGSDGSQADNHSWTPAISQDGRYVAFVSNASNLVVGDLNAADDIFVRDMLTGETRLVSVASDGTQADLASSSPAISADGRWVAFASQATNLVAGDTNGWADIFLHDLVTQETFLVSTASDGTQGDQASDDPSLSADGRYVVFDSRASNLVSEDTNFFCDYMIDWEPDENCKDIFLHDRLSGETRRVSVASDGTQANQESISPAISGNGRYVAFTSSASNLVPDDLGHINHIYVHDLFSGETSKVSVNPDWEEGNYSSSFPSISVDGHYVAFASRATNLIEYDTNDNCVWMGSTYNCSDIFLRIRSTLLHLPLLMK